MAAVVHPAPRHHRPVRPSRPAGRARTPREERHLRVVPPPRHHPAAVYRRRQVHAALAALVLATVLVVAAWTGARALAGALGGVPLHASGAPAATAGAPSGPVHVVQPGDTLWSIARSLQPTGDVRALVDRLAALNGGGALQVGQRLVLPG